MIDNKADSVLKNLEKQEAFEQKNPTKIPQSEKMLAVTRNIGLFYNILLKGFDTQRILEIGTSTGYSTIWFAESLREKNNSKIITIDKDEKKIARAKKNFEEAGVADLIEIKQGDALELIPEIQYQYGSESFDFVFIDADKERYIQYFDATFPLVKLGGVIGADNILEPKRFAKFIKPYLNHVRSNPKVISHTIPIDNGEEITIKLKH